MRFLRPAFLCLLLSATAVARADAPVPLTDEERAGLRAKADALHKAAKEKQEEADRRYPVDKEACYGKFQVSACLDNVDKQHRLHTGEANRLRTEGNDIERGMRARDQAVKAAGQMPEAERQAEALRQKQQQEQQLEDFAKRASERAQRAQEGRDREAAMQGQLQQSGAARQEQARRHGEALQRVEKSRQQTAAYKNAQEKARQRKAEAEAREKELKQKTKAAEKAAEGLTGGAPQAPKTQ